MRTGNAKTVMQLRRAARQAKTRARPDQCVSVTGMRMFSSVASMLSNKHSSTPVACSEKNGEVDAVAHPGRAKWIRKTGPSLYRSHKRAAFLSDMEPVGNY